MKVVISENFTEERILIECIKADSHIGRLKSYIENFDSRIKAKNRGEICYIDLNDVFYFESVDNRTFLYTENEVMEITERLYELEERLSESDFFRSSKSQIINIARIKSLKPQINRTILAVMSNDEKIYISRRYVPQLKKILSL